MSAKAQPARILERSMGPLYVLFAPPPVDRILLTVDAILPPESPSLRFFQFHRRGSRRWIDSRDRFLGKSVWPDCLVPNSGLGPSFPFPPLMSPCRQRQAKALLLHGLDPREYAGVQRCCSPMFRMADAGL
jgi:hypothetical protein